VDVREQYLSEPKVPFESASDEPKARFRETRGARLGTTTTTDWEGTAVDVREQCLSEPKAPSSLSQTNQDKSKREGNDCLSEPKAKTFVWSYLPLTR